MQIMWVLFPPGWHGAVHGMNIAWETIAVCQARQFARRKRTAVCGSFVNRVFFGTRSWPRHVLFQANTEALQMDQHKKTGENQVKEYIPLVRHRNPSKSKVLLITANFLDFRWVDFTSSTLLLFKSSLECKYIQMVYISCNGPMLRVTFCRITLNKLLVHLFSPLPSCMLDTLLSKNMSMPPLKEPPSCAG